MVCFITHASFSSLLINSSSSICRYSAAVLCNQGTAAVIQQQYCTLPGIDVYTYLRCRHFVCHTYLLQSTYLSHARVMIITRHVSKHDIFTTTPVCDTPSVALPYHTRYPILRTSGYNNINIYTYILRIDHSPLGFWRDRPSKYVLLYGV